jgi:hypothetical protein
MLKFFYCSIFSGVEPNDAPGGYGDDAEQVDAQLVPSGRSPEDAGVLSEERDQSHAHQTYEISKMKLL